MRRLLAIGVATALVVGAIAIRWSRDTGSPASSGTRKPRLVCADDLGAACDAAVKAAGGDDRVDVVTERAGATAARLVAAAGPDAGLDAWVVTAPWPAIVDTERAAKGLPALFPNAKGSVVARPKLAIVARKDRADLLAKRPGCAPLGWACLGRAAAVPGGWRALGGPPVWGPVKLGLQSAETATGLALFGQAVAEYFGHSALSSTDLDDDAFDSWLTALVQAIPTAAAPITTIVTASGTYDAVGAIESDASPLAGNTSVVVLYPAPVVSVDVVLAEVAGSVGLHHPPAPTATAQGSLPPPGFLDALRDRLAHR